MVRPYLLILLATLLWALVGVLTTGVLVTGVSAIEIAFWRALMAGGFFLVHALVVKELVFGTASRFIGLMIFGVLGVTLFFAAYNLAIETGGISLAVVLLYTAPVFVIVLARIFLKEAITPRKLIALGLVLSGVMLVAMSGGGEGVRVSRTSLFWGMTAGLGYGSFYVVGKVLLRNYTPLGIYAVSFPVGALGLLPFVSFSPKSPAVWALIVVLAFFSTYLANLFYLIGLRDAEASRAVLVASLEPVMAALLAAIFFGERFGTWGMVGGALVVLASVIGVLGRRRSGVRSRFPGQAA